MVLSGRSNVTVFIRDVGWVIVISSLSSDSSDLHKVSLPIESSSETGSVTAFGLWSFLNRLMHMQVGCSSLHSSHRSGIFVSHLNT